MLKILWSNKIYTYDIPLVVYWITKIQYSMHKNAEPFNDISTLNTSSRILTITNKIA